MALPERTPERAMKTLLNKARAVRSAKADLEGCGVRQDLMEAALDEAAAILEDAAELCAREFAVNGNAVADG